MSKKLEIFETISEDPNHRWCCAKTGFDAAWGDTPEQARKNWEHQQLFLPVGFLPIMRGVNC